MGSCPPFELWSMPQCVWIYIYRNPFPVLYLFTIAKYHRNKSDLMATAKGCFAVKIDHTEVEENGSILRHNSEPHHTCIENTHSHSNYAKTKLQISPEPDLLACCGCSPMFHRKQTGLRRRNCK